MKQTMEYTCTKPSESSGDTVCIINQEGMPVILPRSRVQNPSNVSDKQFSMVMGDVLTGRTWIQCGMQGCTVKTPSGTLDPSIEVANDTVTLASDKGDMKIQFTHQVCSMDKDALNTAAGKLYFDNNAELGEDAKACMPIIEAIKAGVDSFVDNAGLTDIQNLNQCDYPSCQVLKAGHKAACSHGEPSVHIKDYEWSCSAAS